MKAIRVEAQGGPEVLKLAELPTPQPGKGQALVRVDAAGVHSIDSYQRSGVYKLAVPFTLGLEGAGVVEAVGPEVSEVKPGDRVAWAGILGSYATHQLIPAARLVQVPAKLDTKSAAAAMLQGMTAHYLVTDTFALRPGHACLIHAAAGGGGQLFCPLARRAGAQGIGTAGGPEKAELAKQAGAPAGVDHPPPDFQQGGERNTPGARVRLGHDA